jgi:hypothetical protein
MKTRFNYFALVFSHLIINTCPAYTQHITFNQVFPPESPYFRMINGVAQDRQGYMWFSSYGLGLSRYDGYHVTIFRHKVPRIPPRLATNDG